jgi:3',5'-cyclic AMP phosphodiesterase CpdA
VAPDTGDRLDALLAPVLARLAVLERQVAELTAAASVTQPPDPVAAKLDELKTACRELAIFVTWDGFVSEAGAAQLLGKAAHTLKNWRDQHRPLTFRRNGGRIQYDLDEIARFLLAEPPETD